MSIGTNGSNGTNGIALNLLVSIGEMHLIIRTQYISDGFRMSRGAFFCPLVPMVRLVPMEKPSTTGIPLAKSISLYGLNKYPMASGLVGVYSTCPLVPMVQMVPME